MGEPGYGPGAVTVVVAEAASASGVIRNYHVIGRPEIADLAGPPRCVIRTYRKSPERSRTRGENSGPPLEGVTGGQDFKAEAYHHRIA